MSETPVIVGLDIGTTKVCALIGSLTDEQRVDVRGVGTAASAGLRKGLIVDTAATTAAIATAVEAARQMAETVLDGAHVYVGVTGDHLESVNRQGGVEIERPNDEILPVDVDRVRAAAAGSVQVGDREIVLERAREFVVDGRGGITNPVHMSGRRLEVSLHIVTGQRQFLDQLRQVVEKADLPVDSLVVQAMAAGEAVTGADERNLGCAVLDCGGGTTDVGVFLDGVLAHTAALPVGGAHVTYDLSYGLESPYPVAEALKLEHGCALAELCEPGRQVTYQRADGGEATVEQSLLGEIIQPRIEELFELLLANLASVGIEPSQLGSGLVLTGGGSRLVGLAPLARKLTQAAVRESGPIEVVGHAAQVAGPQFAAAVGLLRCGGLDQRRLTEQTDDTSLAGRLKSFYRMWKSAFD